MPWNVQVREGGDSAPVMGPGSLYMADVIEKLQEVAPGITADRGGRTGLWHPDINRKQSIYFGSKHICSADRGWSPQWPEFSTVDTMQEVPLNYALTHDDFPVLDIMPGVEPGCGDMNIIADQGVTAQVLRPQLDDIEQIGWANVAWKLIRANHIPGVDAYWWATTFRVPMDWINTMKVAPIIDAFQRAKKMCGGY